MHNCLHAVSLCGSRDAAHRSTARGLVRAGVLSHAEPSCSRAGGRGWSTASGCAWQAGASRRSPMALRSRPEAPGRGSSGRLGGAFARGRFVRALGRAVGGRACQVVRMISRRARPVGRRSVVGPGAGTSWLTRVRSGSSPYGIGLAQQAFVRTISRAGRVSRRRNPTCTKVLPCRTALRSSGLSGAVAGRRRVPMSRRPCLLSTLSHVLGPPGRVGSPTGNGLDNDH